MFASNPFVQTLESRRMFSAVPTGMPTGKPHVDTLSGGSVIFQLDQTPTEPLAGGSSGISAKLLSAEFNTNGGATT
jgi:hypothetical protein